jgi:hypothetical protein
MKTPSIVTSTQKQKEDNTALIYEDPRSLAELLQQPTVKLAEVLTGVMAVGKQGLGVSLGRVASAALQGKMMRQVYDEVQNLIKQGKLDQDYASSKYGFRSLADLINFIEQDTPDEDQFNAVKTFFFAVGAVNADEKQKAYFLYLLRQVKQLSSSQLMILSISYDIHKKGDSLVKMLNGRSHGDWLKLIAERMGHHSTALVEMEEDGLISMRLLSKRTERDQSGITDQNARLTDLGLSICEVIDKYSYEELTK